MRPLLLAHYGVRRFVLSPSMSKRRHGFRMTSIEFSLAIDLKKFVCLDCIPYFAVIVVGFSSNAGRWTPLRWHDPNS